MSIDVVWEDPHAMVINKPSGLLTTAARGIESVETQLLQFFKDRDGGETNSFGLPHRIDRPVSGALLIGKTRSATKQFCAQFQSRKIQKTYLALIESAPSDPQGTWRDTMRKISDRAEAEICKATDVDAKEATLHFRVLGSVIHCVVRNDASALNEANHLISDHATSIPRVVRNDASASNEANHLISDHAAYNRLCCLSIQLETGRTHQIRLQTAHRGLPIVGDTQYGSGLTFGPVVDDPRRHAIALHAREIGFRHPKNGKLISVTVPLPASWIQIGVTDALIADWQSGYNQ
ncbi:MAG: RluA family pseudouridine synthase [Pirellulaceae bacterium]